MNCCKNRENKSKYFEEYAEFLKEIFIFILDILKIRSDILISLVNDLKTSLSHMIF